MAYLQVKNRARSTLASGIDDDDLVLTVATGEGVKFPASNFVVTIEDERILVGSRTDDEFSSLTRGYDDTVAVAHSEGIYVELRIIAQHIIELQEHTHPAYAPWVLLYDNEVDTAETVSSTTETTKATYALPINTYSKILIEAGTQSRYEADAASKADFTWQIKYNGATQKTFNERIIAQSTSGIDSGGRYNSHISYIMAGGQASEKNITITGQTTVNNSACGFLLKFTRVWGIP